MTKRTKTVETSATTEATLRRCIGSTRFGIEPHDAPVEDFPLQPSQKDGRGRMCRVHWNLYTAGLAKDAKARKAEEAGAESTPATEAAEVEQAAPEPKAKPSRAKRSTDSEPPIQPSAVEDDGSSAVDSDAAEQDAILAERRGRVKSWRRAEAEKALAGG